MTPPVFSGEWASACGAALNQNPAYREAARNWEGAVLLRLTPAAGAEGAQLVYFDLWHGECRAARAATPEDEALARYAMSGTADGWRQVLTGKVAPLMALMTGRIKLTKGVLAELLPHVNAAKELVLTFATVPASYPD